MSGEGELPGWHLVTLREVRGGRPELSLQYRVVSSREKRAQFPGLQLCDPQFHLKAFRIKFKGFHDGPSVYLAVCSSRPGYRFALWPFG